MRVWSGDQWQVPAPSPTAPGGTPPSCAPDPPPPPPAAGQFSAWLDEQRAEQLQGQVDKVVADLDFDALEAERQRLGADPEEFWSDKMQEGGLWVQGGGNSG